MQIGICSVLINARMAQGRVSTESRPPLCAHVTTTAGNLRADAVVMTCAGIDAT
jgi:hypothetical protein